MSAPMFANPYVQPATGLPRKHMLYIDKKQNPRSHMGLNLNLQCSLVNCAVFYARLNTLVCIVRHRCMMKH